MVVIKFDYPEDDDTKRRALRKLLEELTANNEASNTDQEPPRKPRKFRVISARIDRLEKIEVVTLLDGHIGNVEVSIYANGYEPQQPIDWLVLASDYQFGSCHFSHNSKRISNAFKGLPGNALNRFVICRYTPEHAMRGAANQLAAAVFNSTKTSPLVEDDKELVAA